MGRQRFAIAFLLTWLPVLHGCTTSCGGTLASGRSVEVTSDASSFKMANGPETSTIDLGGKSVIVEPTRLVVGGTEVARLDENAKTVRVVESRGAITVNADGKQIYDSRRR